MTMTMKANIINPIYNSLFSGIGFESILTWVMMRCLNLCKAWLSTEAQQSQVT